MGLRHRAAATRVIAEPCSPVAPLALSLSHACRCVCSRIASSSNTTNLLASLWLGPLPCTLDIGNTYVCFHPRHATGLANPACASALRRLDCVDFGIDPPVPTPYALFAQSPFLYVHDGFDFSIAPFHNNYFDVSLSSPRCPLRCSAIDTTTRSQLRRPRPSFSTTSSTTAIAS